MSYVLTYDVCTDACRMYWRFCCLTLKPFPRVHQCPSCQQIWTDRLTINFIFLKNLHPQPLICFILVWLCSKSAANCRLNVGSLFATIWRIPPFLLAYPALVENILQEFLTKHSWDINQTLCVWKRQFRLLTQLVVWLDLESGAGKPFFLRLLKALPPCVLLFSAGKSSATLILVPS